MLIAIAIFLLALWLIGLIAGLVINGLIHILLIVAVIILLVRLFSGRKTAKPQP